MGKTATKKPSSNGHRPAPTFDHLKKKRPLEAELPVCLDPELLSEADEARSLYHLAVLERKPQDEIDSIKERLDAAMTAVDEASIVMRFRSPGRKKYEDLLLEHPPTEEQQQEYAAQYGEAARAPYNSDTFGPPLISLCCIEPRMTVEEVTVLFEGEYDEDGNEITPPWNMNELLPLFTTAMAVCNSSRVGEMGKGFGATPSSIGS